jgi:hypothetical protein
MGQNHAAAEAMRHGAALVLARRDVAPQLLDASAKASDGAGAVRVGAFVRVPQQQKPLLLLAQHQGVPLELVAPAFGCGGRRGKVHGEHSTLIAVCLKSITNASVD